MRKVRTAEDLDEPILGDDYAIYADYLYVADGKVVRSDWHRTTCARFKACEGYKEVRRCDLEGRRQLRELELELTEGRGLAMVEFVKNRVYKVEVDLLPYMNPLTPWNKQLPLPNLELVSDPMEGLRLISWHNQWVKHYNAGFKVPRQNPKYDPGFSTYCHLFLMANMDGSSWKGSGLLVTSHNTDHGRVFKFALCAHEKTTEGHSPNPGRGWHPGHCKLCGMDMTVDSGD